MAAVEVWVDDAVRGHFPGVCVKTGRPAVGLVRVVTDQSPLGLAWLLLLFPRWVGSLALLASRRESTSTRRAGG